ncbi:ABC transporter permease [Chloroflexota bacterium]
MSGIKGALVYIKSKVLSIYHTRKRFYIIPWTIILLVILSAVFADFIAPHSPLAISLPNKLKPPFWMEGGSTEFLLGADAIGRDILSRIIFGARISIIVAVAGLAIAGFIGGFLGLIAGYYGRWVDALIMRTCDTMLSFPIIIVALLLAVVLGPSFSNVIIILTLVLWARYARMVRGEVLSWKQRDFVDYARVAGVSPVRIMIRHLFPNILNSLVVLMTLQAGYVIIMEASLSFLGVGVPPPTPSWGGMTSEGRQYIADAWWVSLFPGLTIVFTCLSLNLIGDWLREHLDPKMRQI